jgi:hypothetical protein
MAMSVELVMHMLARFAWCLAPGVLVACVVSLGAPCVAQEVDTPTLPDAGEGRGSVLAPSAWVLMDVPVQERINLKLYGFYIGRLNAPVAQLDAPIRTSKFLTLTPSYMYYSVPASGLNRLPPEPGRFTETYREHQFRVDGTVPIAIRKLEMSVRHMYVRRFRPSSAGDINRYRGRISAAYPLKIRHQIWKPFVSYETYYERNGGWNRDRIWTGVTLPLKGGVLVQPSYMWESSEGNRDVHYLLFGLIVRTKWPFVHR